MENKVSGRLLPAGWHKINYVYLAWLIVLVAAANIFLYQFYSLEKFVYFWDWSFYESRYEFIVGKFSIGIIPAIKSLLDSIAFTEQSLLVPFLIAPLGLIFGSTRFVYLFSILNIFAIPATIFLAAVFVKLLQPKERIKGQQLKEKQRLFALVSMTIALLTPQFWIPALLGFYDVAAIILISAIWLLLLSGAESSDENKPITKVAIVGVMLTLLIFLRRWLGYWAVSFFGAISAHWAISKITKTKPLWSITNIIICGLAAAAFFALLGAPLAERILNTNYAEIFQAFKSGDSTFGVIQNALEHYGWLSIIFAAAGLILAARYPKNRQFLAIVGIQTVLTLIMFARVQQIDQHHQYQFLPVIILFQSLFIAYLWLANTHLAIKWLLTIVFAVVLVINFSKALIPEFKLNPRPRALFAGARHYPLQRNDTKELSELINFLEKVVQQQQSIYVIASSTVFNEDVLRNSCRYLLIESRICAQVLLSNHVDLRDGFPKQFINADFVIVAEPAQYHLRPVDQRVIGILAGEFINNFGIAAAYRLFPETFHIDRGVKVKIFKRTRELQAHELQRLSEIFLKIYPNHGNLFMVR